MGGRRARSEAMAKIRAKAEAELAGPENAPCNGFAGHVS